MTIFFIGICYSPPHTTQRVLAVTSFFCQSLLCQFWEESHVKRVTKAFYVFEAPLAEARGASSLYDVPTNIEN